MAKILLSVMMESTYSLTHSRFSVEDEGNDGEQTNSFSFAPSLVRSIHISKDFLVFVNHSFHASSIIVW